LVSGEGKDPTSLLDPDSKLLLARSLANQGRLTEARHWCEKAVNAARLQPESHYLLATIYQEQGLGEKALHALKKVLYLDPRFVMAYVSMGNLAKSGGRADESRRYLASALSLLGDMEPGEQVPHSDGMTAQGLRETLEWMMNTE